MCMAREESNHLLERGGHRVMVEEQVGMEGRMSAPVVMEKARLDYG